MLGTEEIAAWVGLDWAEDQHEIRLQAAGSREVESYQVRQDPEALHAWISQLRARFEGRPVVIALEHKRGGLMAALMCYDFLHLYPINPRTVASYRVAFSPAGKKDDPDDAGLLLELVHRHRDRFRVWRPEAAQTRQLQLLVEGRRQWVGQRKRLGQQLVQVLKSYYPQPLQWFEDVDRPLALEFLSRWSSLEQAREVRIGVLRRCFARHRVRCREPKVQTLLEQIRASYPLTQDEALLEAGALKMVALVEQLLVLLPVIQRYERHIARLFSEHQDAALFESFSGAGPALAPRLLVAFGSDRSRFEDAREIQQWSGIAPVTRQSGRSSQVVWRRGCPKFVRQTFHEFAACSIPHSRWAHAYYRQQRQRGLGHHAAVRALAYKWIRILFRCWKDRVPYDEELYCQSLQRRNSPLLALMQPACG